MTRPTSSPRFWALVGILSILLVFGAPPVRAETLDRDQVTALAAEYFGADVAPYVARIANCESEFATTAKNEGWDPRYGRYRYRGLLQIEQGLWGPVALRLTGSDDLFDPRVNMATGAWLQQQFGWEAWPVCRHR